MAQSVRSFRLENRANQIKLPISKKPIYLRVAPGVSLGYRRNQIGSSWVVRVADGKGGAWTNGIGIADDHAESDGQAILTFWEAQDRAKEIANGDAGGKSPAGPLTVSVVAETYLAALETRNQRTAYDAKLRLDRLFLPQFGNRAIRDLTRGELEKWRDGLVRKTNDAEKRRKSQDTANRVLSIVKALLNHAISNPKNKLHDDSAWRLVRPFQKVGRAREVHFTSAEVARLIAACATTEFKNLVTASFLTGARYGELIACRVRDFDDQKEVLNIPSGKTGQRTVILQADAVRFFSRLIDRRDANAPLLSHANGGHWKSSDQQRPMEKAIAAADLDPCATFYSLRHSYISRAIEAGVPLNVVGKNCGTSVRMIETNYAKALAYKQREFIQKGAPTLA